MTKGLHIPCAECSTLTYVYPVNVRKNKTGNFFCKAACMHAFNSRQRLTLICEYCSTTFTRPISNMRGTKHSFCSQQCAAEYNTGARNPRYKGGGIRYRGRDWKEQSTKAKERDSYTCQDCGIQNVTLATHHLIPYHITHDNSLDNLLTLCYRCHRKADTAWQRANGIKRASPKKTI